MPVDSINTSGIPCATLENIEVFKLDVLYRSKVAEDNAGCLLANSIRMPNLSTMDLMVKFTFDSDKSLRKDPYVFGLLPDPTVHRKLKSLRLTTYDERARDEHIIQETENRCLNISSITPHWSLTRAKPRFLRPLWLRTNLTFV